MRTLVHEILVLFAEKGCDPKTFLLPRFLFFIFSSLLISSCSSTTLIYFSSLIATPCCDSRIISCNTKRERERREQRRKLPVWFPAPFEREKEREGQLGVFTFKGLNNLSERAFIVVVVVQCQQNQSGPINSCTKPLHL